MISIQINEKDVKKIESLINKKIGGIKEISNPKSLTEIAKATFTITGKKFVRDINSAAKFDNSLKHVYEWKGVGVNTQRLFTINRARVSGGNLVITSKFLKSKKPVPIKPQLLKSGKSGKVVRAKNIFRDKARVMEENKPLNIISRRYLVFPGREGNLVFISKGKSVRVKNPGGKIAKNSFTKYMLSWYKKNGSIVMENSPIFKQIEKNVTKALNSQNGGAKEARSIVELICQKYSEGRSVI